MHSVKADFDNRKLEIDCYFDFTKIIDDEKNTKIENVGTAFVITTQLQKILLANGFLILYNLIESSIRNSITEIFYQMTANSLSYTKSIDKIKSVWLDHEIYNFRQGTYNHSTLKSKVSEIVNKILDNEILELIEANEDFSGNLDARKIKEWAAKFGIPIPTKAGENLLTIKNKRNLLAHGNSTFTNIGKDFTVKELIAFKEETYEFLEDVLAKVEHFLVNKSYELTTVSVTS